MLTFVRSHFAQLVLLANAGGFAILLGELLILGHTDGIQLVAPITASAGIALSLAAIVVPAPGRLVLAGVLVLLSGAGLLGVTRHLDERDEGLSLAVVTSASAQSDDDDDSGQGRGRGRGRGGDEDDAEPPPLAPLGLSGTAMLSALAAVAGTGPRREIAS